MRATLWDPNSGVSIAAELAFKNNLGALAAPAVTDDSADGYQAGSMWVYNGTVYVCTDDTVGAAVWTVLSSGSIVPGQVIAPAASTVTGTGSAAELVGGTGGSTSGAGGAAATVGGAATGGNSAGGEADLTGGAAHGTGTGGAAKVAGGVSGAGLTGDGGAATVTGGAAASSNGNGGSVVLAGGAKTGTGIAGGVRIESIIIRKQGAPTAKTVSATLTAAEILAGIVTINQGAGATSAQQLPTGTAIQAALPADFAVDDSFDVSFMNISTVDAEDASVTTNTDLTLVGSMDFPAHSGITLCSCGILRFRKTADHVFSVYRIG